MYRFWSSSDSSDTETGRRGTGGTRALKVRYSGRDIEHDERTREQEQFHDGLIPEWWCDLQAAERRAEAARGEDEEKRRAEALGLAVASDPAEEARLAELNSRFADFTFDQNE